MEKGLPGVGLGHLDLRDPRHYEYEPQPCIPRLEITHIKYRQRLCGQTCVMTLFRRKYSVSAAKISFLVGYMVCTNVNSF